MLNCDLQIYKEKKAHTKPPVSLLGQLLWREFYYCAAAHTPNYHRMEGNPICKQIDWWVCQQSHVLPPEP